MSLYECEVLDGFYIDGAECWGVVTCSSTGAEVWLYVSKEGGELLAAERIDGDWSSLDLDEARERYASILYQL